MWGGEQPAFPMERFRPDRPLQRKSARKKAPIRLVMGLVSLRPEQLKTTMEDEEVRTGKS